MIDTQTIKNMARLARLEINTEAVDGLSKQLSEIMAYAAIIRELDLKDIEPTSHAVTVQNVFRDDHVINADTASEALPGAPDHEGRFFKVPKVL
ncbi:MAG: Asp-tRNA(Asn)/Glu-tRNA(Gln) amidotransferase subunit GatC [Deltaproteobacteria bacterium]|nr:Asp-tRNA(Asn)/Glu-tRNA(Gln) amidotransferase subunit GatC [Deltaproteobacteria bacterium]